MAYPLRFVVPLSDQQKQHLVHVYRNDPSPRARERAQAILLSHRRYSISEIARLFETDRDTIARWIDQWEDGQNLHDALRSGRPPKLSVQQQTALTEALDEQPSQLKAVAATLGLPVSLDTLRRTVRKARYSWRRIRLSLRERRDEAAFRRAQVELGALEEREAQGAMSLYYFDAAGFSRTPSVPYAWQPAGQRREVLTTRSTQINVLGWVRRSGEFESFVVDGSVCGETVAACLEAFSAGLPARDAEHEVVIVLDGASVHRSRAVWAWEARWRDRGVRLYRLPSYSPELNRVELVWQAIKYRWLPLSAYASDQVLRRALDSVLVGIGSKYRITFA